MDELTKKVLTDQRLVAYQEEWFRKLEALFDGTGENQMALSGIFGASADPALIYREPERWMEEAMDNLAQRAYDAISAPRFVPLCVESALYGVHFVDKILGAEVFFQDGQWYNHSLKQEVGELELPNLEENETWKLARRVAEAFLASETTVPLFGLPTIASVANIAVNLYGEEILVAMLSEPEAAEHDLRIINEVLKEIHSWYLAHIPMKRLQPVISWDRTQPPGYGQICGCTTQLVSPALYEEFLYPLDNELLGVYPRGGMIHLCGSHGHLIPLFAKMQNLKSVQLNDRAAGDLELYVRGLRANQVIYLNPCKEMPLERGLEIAAGRRLVVVGDYKL